jgi:hypothetical protein
MSKLTTLGEVFDRDDQLSKHCRDNLVKVEDIKFENLETVRIANKPHHMRPIAQQSFAYRLGIPIQYLRKCPPEVQAYNMNHWIKKEKNEELFVRFDDEEIRALFTKIYKPVDNFQVIERLDSIGYGPDTKVQCNLDGTFMSLNIPDGNKTFSINGDKITPGISICNSEVGLSSLHIAAFFLRLVCTNGMVSKTEISSSYRHVSTKILNEFPEVIEKVSGELAGKKDQFKISIESPVDNPASTIEAFNRQFQLGKVEKEAVEWAWPLEAGDTMFNVVNAYTRAAQFQGLTAEASYRLQRVGGNILGMLN